MVGRNFLEHPQSSNHEIVAPHRKDLNLQDRDAVQKRIRCEKPDLIIHAAGLVGGIQANIKEPVRFLLENTDMGLNVISSAVSAGVKNLINLGSSCMYPKDNDSPLTEDAVLKGQLEPTNEGYALAKIVSTRLCEYIARENSFFNYKTFIPCNLYGRYDKYDDSHSHLIPAVIKKIHEANLVGRQTIDIWGDGLARREFMNVRDLVDFIYFAMGQLEALPQNINIGIGHDYSISDYYKVIASVVGFNGDFVHDLSKPVGMNRKLVDVTAVNKLGWHHKVALREGIAEAYECYKEAVDCGV